MAFKRAENWINKRKPKKTENNSNYHTKEKHVDFAKELFLIWDEDQAGTLDLDEITKPLIALGLSTDS